MSCNFNQHRREIPGQGVSIPIGFSNELQHSTPLPSPHRTPVSIPIGFSNELQQFAGREVVKPARVSIPIGFSNELQRRQG
mgnify:CR=1 FL=1